MVIILGTLAKYQTKLDISELYGHFLNHMLTAETGGLIDINKLQHLLHRYYSEIYVDSLKQMDSRKDYLLKKFSTILESNYVWGQFVESVEPVSELEEARTAYNRYHL